MDLCVLHILRAIGGGKPSIRNLISGFRDSLKLQRHVDEVGFELEIDECIDI